jgi:hypothetical protein
VSELRQIQEIWRKEKLKRYYEAEWTELSKASQSSGGNKVLKWYISQTRNIGGGWKLECRIHFLKSWSCYQRT